MKKNNGQVSPLSSLFIQLAWKEPKFFRFIYLLKYISFGGCKCMQKMNINYMDCVKNIRLPP